MGNRKASQLPETWRCQDGRELLIRDMEDEHISNCIALLRRNGYVSRQEWRERQPDYPTGTVVGDFAQDAFEAAFSDEWAAWLRLKPCSAIDAFSLELAYRRRHGIKVARGPVGVPIGVMVDGVPSPSPVPALDWGHVAQNRADLNGDAELWPPVDGGTWPKGVEPSKGDVVSVDRHAPWDDMHEVHSVEGNDVTLVHRAQPGAVLRMSLGKFKKRFYLMASAAAGG